MRNPLIRTIYLYLFALVGLGMFVVGASMLINLGLKTWIFTKADEEDIYLSRPSPVVIKDPELQTAEGLKVCSDKCQLTATQREQIDVWLSDYKNWQETEKNRDLNAYVRRNRERQASTATSLILIGLPLWLFHWLTIKRDIKANKQLTVNN